MLVTIVCASIISGSKASKIQSHCFLVNIYRIDFANNYRPNGEGLTQAIELLDTIAPLEDRSADKQWLFIKERHGLVS